MIVNEASFLSVGRIACRGGWAMESHFHGIHEVIVVQKGAVAVESCRGPTSGREGEALLYPAGLRHAERSAKPGPLELFFVSFSARLGVRPPPMKAPDVDGRMRQIMRWLYADRHLSGTVAERQRNALLNALIGEYAKNCVSGEDRFVAAARAYMRQRLGDSVSLDQIAQHMGMSKFHFARQYRRLAGGTPWNDMLRIRADLAREMIMTTTRPLKQIAPLCGLGSESAMCRLFRRLFSTTPGELRRLAGGTSRSFEP